MPDYDTRHLEGYEDNHECAGCGSKHSQLNMIGGSGPKETWVCERCECGWWCEACGTYTNKNHGNDQAWLCEKCSVTDRVRQ